MYTSILVNFSTSLANGVFPLLAVILVARCFLSKFEGTKTHKNPMFDSCWKWLNYRHAIQISQPSQGRKCRSPSVLKGQSLLISKCAILIAVSICLYI